MDKDEGGNVMIDKEVSKVSSSNKLFLGAVLLILCVFSLRILKLDVDLPGYGVGAYNPSDEGIYAFMALNVYNNGELNPKVEVADGHTVVPYTAYHCRNNLIENILVYAGMSIFGDNYTGFRIAITFISFCNLLLIMLSAWLIVKHSECDFSKGKWIVVGIGAFYTLSFPYLISSRVVEPTIIRMFFSLLVFFIFLWVKNTRLQFFLMGLVATISIELVYITNLFLYIPIFVAGCMIGWKNGKRKFIDAAVFCILGCICSLGIGAIYYHAIWGTNFFSNTINIFKDFSSTSGYTVLTYQAGFGFVHAILKAILKFFSANTFLYHMPLLAAFLFLLPSVVRRILREKDEVAAFSLAAVFGLILQTCYTEDYIFRKGFLVQPFVCFIIVIHILDSIRGTKNEQTEYTTKVIAKVCYALIVFTFIMFCLYYRLISGGDTVNDFTKPLKLFLMLTQGVGTFALLILAAVKGKLQKHVVSMLLFVVVGCSIVLNGVCSIHYVWANKYTTEKDVMIELDQYSGETFFGPYSYGFSLYNDVHPVLLRNEAFWELIPDHDENILYIDVSTDAGTYVRDYLNYDAFAGSKYTMAQVVPLERRFAINGNITFFGIYKPVLKQNLGFYEQLLAIQNEKKDDGYVTPEDRDPIYAEVAMRLYDINKRYEALSLHKDYEHQLIFAMEENEAVESLFEEMGIHDQERSVFSNMNAQYGDINSPVYGSVYGDIHGDINDHIYGDVYGNIYGHINVPIYGVIYGSIVEPTRGEKQ